MLHRFVLGQWLFLLYDTGSAQHLPPEEPCFITAKRLFSSVPFCLYEFCKLFLTGFYSSLVRTRSLTIPYHTIDTTSVTELSNHPLLALNSSSVTLVEGFSCSVSMQFPSLFTQYSSTNAITCHLFLIQLTLKKFFHLFQHLYPLSG